MKTNSNQVHPFCKVWNLSVEYESDTNPYTVEDLDTVVQVGNVGMELYCTQKFFFEYFEQRIKVANNKAKLLSIDSKKMRVHLNPTTIGIYKINFRNQGWVMQ